MTEERIVQEVSILRERVAAIEKEMSDNAISAANNYQKLHHEYVDLAVSEANFRKRVAALREAIDRTIARADDFCDSQVSQPVREALAQDDAKEKE